MRIRRVLSIWCVIIALLALVIPFVRGLVLPLPTKYTAVHQAAEVPNLEMLNESSVFNAGDVAALDAFPGVGEVIARRMIETREILGGFLFAEDVMLVKGIGEKTFAGIMEAYTGGDD